MQFIEAMDLGIKWFAGEAEGRLEELLRTAYHGELKPLYNFMNDLPSLEGEPVPYLPVSVVRRTMGVRTSFDLLRPQNVTPSGRTKLLREYVGKVGVPIARTFPLDAWRDALAASLGGGARGKLVLIPSAA